MVQRTFDKDKHKRTGHVRDERGAKGKKEGVERVNGARQKPDGTRLTVTS